MIYSPLFTIYIHHYLPYHFIYPLILLYIHYYYYDENYTTTQLRLGDRLRGPTTQVAALHGGTWRCETWGCFCP